MRESRNTRAELEGTLIFGARVGSAVALLVVVPLCLALIALTALQWSLVDLLTPFLLAPLLIGLWALLILATVASLVMWLLMRPRRVATVLPLLICGLTLAVLVLVPFERISTALDFARHEAAREALVEQVVSGALEPDEHGLIALGSQAPLLSRGGNEVVVEEIGGEPYVLFYTYRGAPDGYSGFLWVPSGGDPRRFGDLGEPHSSTVRPYGGHWYWVKHE